jgi:glycerol-3-phosphate dehydrogenase
VPTPRRPPWDSATTVLPGGDFASREALAAEAGAVVHDAAVGAHLAQAYGTRWRRVWAYVDADPSLGHRLHPDLPYLLAEIRYAVAHEHAHTMADLLVRRTHVAFETRDNGRAVARELAPRLAGWTGWDAAGTAAAVAAYDHEVARLFAVDAA